jgi:hypothetical protein
MSKTGNIFMEFFSEKNRILLWIVSWDKVVLVSERVVRPSRTEFSGLLSPFSINGALSSR